MAIREQEFIDAALSQEFLTDEQLTEVRQRAHEQDISLIEAVCIFHRIPLKAIYHAVANERGIRFVDLAVESVSIAHAQTMSEVGLQRGVIPVLKSDGNVILATADVDDLASISNVEHSLDIIAEVGLATPDAITDAIGQIQIIRQTETSLVIQEDTEHATELLDRIINEAYMHHASDVHLEPTNDGIKIRFRVDGRLITYVSSLPPDSGRSLISRVKVLSGLDIAEQRAPQDGRMRYALKNTISQDMRVAVIPTRFGERITIRLLGTTDENLTLSTLGMLDSDLVNFRNAIQRPHGIILLTGPTGSGKSTTLYSALKEINTGWRNIVTVEDPIEQVVSGVSQIQVGASDKVTFESALRSILRHDPDVIMVGEIRDLMSADISLKAALTGHLVLSSLHTNTAVGAVTRLTDFGCPPYLVGATLTGAVSQRLVRRLCQACSEETTATEQQLQIVGEHDINKVFSARGCPQCLGTGYSGRLGLFECFWTNDETRRLISNNAHEDEISTAGRQQHRTMLQDGLEKVGQQLTSLSEVIRVTLGSATV